MFDAFDQPTRLKSIAAAQGQAPFDLLLTDPPYAQMMARPKTGESS